MVLSQNTTNSNYLLNVLAGCMLFLLACLILGSLFSVKSLKAQSSQSHPTLFAALAEYVATNGLEFTDQRHLKQLQIDPHMIDTTYFWSIKLQKKHLVEESTKQIREHKNILKSLGIPITDAITDQDCVGSGGLPEPPDPDNPNKEKSSPYPSHCDKQGFFLTVIFEKPQRTADTICTEESHHLTSQNTQCWKVKAFEYTSYSHFIYSIYVHKDPQNGWVVMRKKRLWGFSS